MTKEKSGWIDQEPYKGCEIQHREGYQRLNWRVLVPNQLGSAFGGYQTHNSRQKCEDNIDHRIRKYGQPTEAYTYEYMPHFKGNEQDD